ncbi:MAG: AI-2E family transporter [Candidatus Zixiibacteriota bacterium]
MEEDDGLSLNDIMIPILALSAFTALCYFAAVVLVPMVMAITMAYVLWPMIARLKRWKMPHLIAVLVVVLLAVILLSLAGLLIYGEASDFVNSVPEYWEQFQQLRVEKFSEMPAAMDTLVNAKIDELLEKIDITSLSSLPKYFFKGVGSVLSFVGQAVLVFLLTIFVLIEQPTYHRRIKKIFGEVKPGATAGVVDQISNRIAGYIWVRFVTTVGLAIVFSIGLMIGGIKYAYIWGPLAAMLNLVPYVGAYVGAVPPMIMALVQFHSVTAVLLVLAFIMAVQFVESYIVMPRMLQGSLNISLLAQLVSTIYWGWLWGAVGIVLAVPITAAVKVFCDNIKTLKPLGILLSGDET